MQSVRRMAMESSAVHIRKAMNSFAVSQREEREQDDPVLSQNG